MKYHKRYLEAHNALRMSQISALLKEFRVSNGYTREDIEYHYGIPCSVLQRVESLEPTNISLKTILEVADIYMISPAELFQEIC
jgi:transcriptional regulator with XRE-family HTH domain